MHPYLFPGSQLWALNWVCRASFGIRVRTPDVGVHTVDLRPKTLSPKTENFDPKPQTSNCAVLEDSLPDMGELSSKDWEVPSDARKL